MSTRIAALIPADNDAESLAISRSRTAARLASRRAPNGIFGNAHGFVPGRSRNELFRGRGEPCRIRRRHGAPHEGVLWLVARLMLDSAGGLFGIYLLTFIGLSLAGHVMRSRDRISGPVRNRIGAPADTPIAGPTT